MSDKSPSYKGYTPSSAKTSRVLRAVKSQDTRPEVMLRKELWDRGLRYRLHPKGLPGRPDLVFVAARVAVFCDGDFWHGRDWPARRTKLSSGANADYWIAKIEANMRRDRTRSKELCDLGWTVVRVWESDILSDVHKVAERIQSKVRRRDS